MVVSGVVESWRVALGGVLLKFSFQAPYLEIEKALTQVNFNLMGVTFSGVIEVERIVTLKFCLVMTLPLQREVLQFLTTWS
jgi:hypothetical protein